MQEVKVAPGVKVSGFNIAIKHSSEEGIASQVKLLRVYGVTCYGAKKVIFQTTFELQTFVIPKCRPNQLLSYRFADDVTTYHHFNFEWVSSYGGPLVIPCAPKITLYKLDQS